MKWALLATVVLVGCAPFAPTPTYHATTTRGEGPPYPARWMERQAQNGYDCTQCHAATEAADRSH